MLYVTVYVICKKKGHNTTILKEISLSDKNGYVGM